MSSLKDLYANLESNPFASSSFASTRLPIIVSPRKDVSVISPSKPTTEPALTSTNNETEESRVAKSIISILEDDIKADISRNELLDNLSSFKTNKKSQQQFKVSEDAKKEAHLISSHFNYDSQ